MMPVTWTNGTLDNKMQGRVNLMQGHLQLSSTCSQPAIEDFDPTSSTSTSLLNAACFLYLMIFFNLRERQQGTRPA